MNHMIVPDSCDELEGVERAERMFELAQRQAKIYAQSSLVPKEYQNNIGNVLIAQNMARRLNADTLMVMQNLYVVHGRPGWSSQFLIGTFNQCGRFSAIKYRLEGTPGQPGSSCVAYTTERETGEVIEGPRITWEMVVAEGWAAKNGSKWKSMPEQMFRYRAAAFLIRTLAPEIAMGIPAADEIEDAVQEPPRRPALAAPTTLDEVADMLGSDPSDPPESPPGESNQDDETKLTQLSELLKAATTLKQCVDLDAAYDFASEDAQMQASAMVTERKNEIKGR